MNINPSMIVASYSAKVFICLFIFMMGRWSLFSATDGTASAPLIRSRNKAITVGFFGCFGLGLLSFLDLSVSMGRLAPLAGLTAYFSYLHLDPTKVGYWHHRRMRPIGIFIGLLGTLIFGVFSFDQTLSALFFATLIFHRHQKFSRFLVQDQLRNQELLRKKILYLEADCLSLSARGESHRQTAPQVATLVQAPQQERPPGIAPAG